MSMKIYDGYLWTGTPDELMQFLNELRPIFENDAVELLCKYQHLIESNRDLYIILKDAIQHGEDTELNLNTSMMVYFYANKIVIVPFGFYSLPNLKKAFQSGKIKFYGYWNNSDPDESCSESEWNERKRFWEGTFGNAFLFDTSGLIYEFSNDESLMRIVSLYNKKVEI